MFKKLQKCLEMHIQRHKNRLKSLKRVKACICIYTVKRILWREEAKDHN